MGHGDIVISVGQVKEGKVGDKSDLRGCVANHHGNIVQLNTLHQLRVGAQGGIGVAGDLDSPVGALFDQVGRVLHRFANGGILCRGGAYRKIILRLTARALS